MIRLSGPWGRIALLSLFVLALTVSITAVPHAQSDALQPKIIGQPVIPLPGTPGGTLNLGATNSPGTFHPYTNFNTIPQIAFSALLETNPVTLQFEGALASSFSISPESSALTVTLRDGVRWSDGEPIDSADIQFTFVDILQNQDIVTALNNAGAGIALPNYEIRVINDRVVEFGFADTSADSFLFNLTGFPLLPEHVLGGLSSADEFVNAYGIDASPDQLVGSGPFQFSAIALDDGGNVNQVQLVRNEHYFKADVAFQPLPYLDEVIFNVFPDDANLNDRLASGEVDLIGPFGADQAVTISQLEGVQIVQAQESLGTSSIMFNQDTPDANLQSLLRNDLFRLAIAQSLDRDALLGLQPEQSQFLRAAESFVHPASPFFDAASNPTEPQNLPHANALLDSIEILDNDGDGFREYADGSPVTFVFNVNDNNSTRVAAGQELTRIWRDELGLDVQFLAEPFPDLQARFDFANRTADFEMMLVAFGIGFTTIQDPSYLNCQFSSGGFCHVHRFSDPEGATERQLRMDEIFVALTQIGLTLTERVGLERELQQLIAEDRGQIPMWRNTFNNALRDDIQNGASIGLPGQALSISYMWR